MVTGLETFAAAFDGLGDRYVLIGGAAAHLRFRAAGLEFRATRDLDLVIAVDALDALFVERFWGFVQDGGYDLRQRSNGTPIKYRFTKPARPDYPHIIELFADASFASSLHAEITPLLSDGEHSSLSAILLDDAYRAIVAQHCSPVEGVTCLTPRGLILLKAKAWLDLSSRHEAGEAVDSRDIKKHRNDVFRVALLLEEGAAPRLPPSVLEDLHQFLKANGEREADWPAIKASCKGLPITDPEVLLGLIESAFAP